MSLELKKAEEEDLEVILNLQRQAFEGLLCKYEDYDMNPGSESIDNIKKRFDQPFTDYLLIEYIEQVIGAIRVIKNEKDQVLRISPMFISPSFQGLGLAQKVFDLIEAYYPWATIFKLETILQEEKLCYLYEKMGFKKTGLIKEIKEGMTIVYYSKQKND